MALYFGDILPEVFKVQNIFRLENSLLKSIEANAEISKIGLKFTNSDSIQGNKIYTIKNSGETFDSVGNSFEAIEILPH